MNQEIQQFLSSPEFQRIPPAKANMIREMIMAMENKDANTKLQILIAYGFKMKNAGLSLTQAESTLMINALQGNMTPAERQKIKTLLQMF